MPKLLRMSWLEASARAIHARGQIFVSRMKTPSETGWNFRDFRDSSYPLSQQGIAGLNPDATRPIQWPLRESQKFASRVHRSIRCREQRYLPNPPFHGVPVHEHTRFCSKIRTNSNPYFAVLIFVIYAIFPPPVTLGDSRPGDSRP
jgi:hypothetical protein